MNDSSPYLSNSMRLADVMTAIQYLGTHKYGSRSTENWSKSLDTPPKSADYWIEIFEEHPEFFRKSGEYVALVLRRTKPKNYHRETGETLTENEIENLPSKERKKITRRPLDPEQIETLLGSAIKMHSSAIAHRKELRWWIPLLASLLGVIIGAVLKK